MYPWALHHRLLLAFLLPILVLLISLSLVISAHYRDDLLARYKHSREATLRSTAEIINHSAMTNSDLQALLTLGLRDESIRQLSVLSPTGKLQAQAGQSQAKMPQIELLQRANVLQGSLSIAGGDQDFRQLADGRWLVVDSTQQVIRLAFYERLGQYIALSLALLMVLAMVLLISLRRNLLPISLFAAALNQPEKITPEEHALAKRIWPELVSFLTRYYFQQKTAMEQLIQDSEHAEAELRETLDAIERQNIELHATRRSAQVSNQLKSEFLANISHEIRTPLTSLLGFARLLERSPLSASQQPHVQALSRSGEHLLAILNDLLDLSKIEAGRLVLDETPVQLGNLLSESTAMLAPLLGDKAVEIQVDIDPRLPESVLGDPLRLRQIMTNLISNAIKFTAHGHIQTQLKLLAEEAGRVHCQLIVSDTGVGIDPSRLQRLFEAFEQADSSTSRHFGGTGLGLTITRQLVHIMGGDISAVSEAGKGSTFTVSWWASRDPFFHSALTNPQGHTQLHYNQLASSPIRVLVVDDHPANLELMQVWLSELGISVETAENGALAIEKAGSRTFDLIFMDIQMPIMNGLEAAQGIRAQERGGQRVPIIALTAHALNSEREFWLRNGIDDYLSKPLDESQLHHILQQWTRFINAPLPAIDWPEAERLAGGRRELAEKLISTLAEDIPLAREQFLNAYQMRDADAWRRAVHRLLGACRYTGVPALRGSLEAALSLSEGTWDEALQQRILREMDALLQATNARN
jgi:two-component system sensor histidine kinase BarA